MRGTTNRESATALVTAIEERIAERTAVWSRPSAALRTMAITENWPGPRLGPYHAAESGMLNKSVSSRVDRRIVHPEGEAGVVGTLQLSRHPQSVAARYFTGTRHEAPVHGVSVEALRTQSRVPTLHQVGTKDNTDSLGIRHSKQESRPM